MAKTRRKLGALSAKSIAKKNFTNNLTREIFSFSKPPPTQQNQVFRLAGPAKKFLRFSLILTSLSCAQDKPDSFDKTTDMSIADVQKAMLRDSKEEKLRKLEKAQNEAPLPSISKLIVSPPPPAIGGDKIISFSVTDQVPLKDVLIELGRVANIDIDLDSGISGGVIINAKSRPFKEVIDRIATLGNLRYSYKNGVLYFERDTPYMKNYFVDYLSDGPVWSDVESNISAILSASSGNSGGGEAGGDSQAGGGSSNASFTSNKSAGIISLFANQKQHDAIARYLADVARTASAQVLIEAKVVEVQLSDNYQAGIDWSWTGSPVNVAIGKGSVTILNGGISASINALETFGITKTISSPRIHAMNNQKATLNFTDKLVYFKVENNQSQAGVNTGGSTPNNVVATNSNSTKQEENVGIELAITPSINLETKEITMTITPKLSVKSGQVQDPVNPLNFVPVIQTRQLSTIAKIQNGNVLVIGGLMKDSTSNTDTGTPFLNKIPLLGWLFKSVLRDSTVIETVIFIKATIVSSGAAANKFDRDLQEKFDPNKRRYFE